MRKKIPKKSRTKTHLGRSIAQPVLSKPLNAGISYSLIRFKVCGLFNLTQIACEGEPERGGILLGCHRGQHLEITDFTEPGLNDLASLSSFTRVDKNHQQAATEAWIQSNETVTYVGEWHSHPFGPPQPSSLDHKNWNKVAEHLKTPSLFVIVSPLGWQVFRTRSSMQGGVIVQLELVEYGISGIVFR